MLFAPLSLSYAFLSPFPLSPPLPLRRFLPLVLFSARFPLSILYFYAGLIRTSRAWARAKIGTATGMIQRQTAAQRKWGRLQLVLTYVLYSLFVCYFRLNVCFPASRVYLHRRLAPSSLMNLFFRAVLLRPSEARLEGLKFGDIISRRRRKKMVEETCTYAFLFFLVEINQVFILN